jgi:hypothetical protein
MEEITFNQEMISKHVKEYKEKYKKTFNKESDDWWGFTIWLSNRTLTRNFTPRDIDFAKHELGIK